VPLVIVDVHERRSGIACLLEQLGARVEMRRLLSGDYLPAPRTLVERKTVYDLHAAILAGRFWRQMAVLRDSASWTYLLVEGSSLYSGRLSPEAIRGAILALTDLGVIVLRSIDRGDTAAWIYRIAMRRQSPRARDYPPYAQRAAYREQNGRSPPPQGSRP
jgi:ERCC4-type nuclease